jgi:hypothetical protein
MEIVILHDPRRPDKEWERCRKELERQGIEDYHVEFARPHEGQPHEAISASHKRLVTLAKDNGLKEVCIMESDVMFPAADGWEYFLKNKPAEFDLYLAATYGEFRGELPHIIEGRNYYYVDHPAGFHCYIIHERYYDTFLATPPDLHIDDAQTGGDFRVCYPFAALQRPGWSANAKGKVNYNNDLLHNRKHDVYGW